MHLYLLLAILFTGCAPTAQQSGYESYSSYQAPQYQSGAYQAPAKFRFVKREEPVYTEPMPVPQPVLTQLPVITKGPGGLIIIDPGHGGEDAGTRSLTKPRYQEKYLTLTTSKFLRDYLTQMGYQTVMTRNDDTFIPLITRAEMANKAEPALFVSVHYNSAPSAEAQGIEVFYYQSDSDKPRTKASKELATTVLTKVLRTTEAKSRGVKRGDFAVIRETKMPAVLIEGGFLTNQEELEKIKDPNYLKQIAWGIAQGVDAYMKKNTK